MKSQVTQIKNRKKQTICKYYTLHARERTFHPHRKHLNRSEEI